MSNSTLPSSQIASQTLQNYPTPLSPPLPSISKEVELARAMSASSKSSLFKLSRTDVLYEDEWLIAVNKPPGVYCESVLASAPCLLSGGSVEAGSDRLSEGLFLTVSGVFILRNARTRDEAANTAPIMEPARLMEVEEAAFGGDSGAGVGLISTVPAGAGDMDGGELLKAPRVIESEDGVALGEVRPGRICAASVGVGLSGTQVNLPELHLANRLDRDTSGVMIITKSHKVAATLVKAFTDHKIRKTYIALCIGLAPKWEQITIKSGHGRSKFGVWRVYAASDVGRTLPGGSSVRDMVTSFEVLSVNGKGSFKETSNFQKDEENVIIVEEKAVIDDDAKKGEILVRAFPQSGRTHQIRLHCQYLGISIRGDVKYEGVYEWKGKTYEGHELHAESLSFEHPVTGCPVMFRAPLPFWATQVLHSISN
ncbi:hypothetical protein Ddye_027046 [Dipteronia dyeriana]|uniref:Pseudouridine synthase RsuA/RluA-like domain-containing protein n=1 Tax=Dipteronia dyeriana TaxID=168575 RepID=A0AAD9WQZ7_9ROSI|nr:hypothetical protein Ddye_026993 [Dipteronia dyeriana]KAK2639251.1 hypothetical protein Ddye_027046 [Dipteronia dyeriana]